MKILPFAALLLLVPPVLAPAQKGGAEESELEKRVVALEDELTTLKDSRTQEKALLEQTLAYLETQALEAEKMLASLDESEQLGFTAGINFRSREVLLAGMRAFWSEVQKGPPKAPAKGKAEPATPPARQRSGT